MSNPGYIVKFRLTIICGAKNVTMERGLVLPFPPREGDTLRVWDEDNESYHAFVLCNLHWDVGAGEFVEELVDDDLVPAIVDKTVTQEALVELVTYYKSFGFVRKEFPEYIER